MFNLFIKKKSMISPHHEGRRNTEDIRQNLISMNNQLFIDQVWDVSGY